MSSFNHKEETLQTEHTIFYGTNPSAEATFTESHTQVVYAPLWDEATEKEYMERVKNKATKEATIILQKSIQDAESIRLKAQQEGFAQGEKNAKNTTEKTSIEYVRYFESILHAMEEYSQTIYNQLEKDIISIVEVAVESITSIVIEKESKEVIRKALIEAVQLVAMDKEFIISVNPEDYQSVLDIIHTLYDVYPASKHWHVKKNTDIPLGSCQFEDSINVISVNRQKRKEKVMEILSTMHFIKE